MSQLNKHVFERSAALCEFAHRPMAFNGEPEDLFAHIRTRFDSQRESLPLLLTVGDDVPDAGNFF